MHFAFYFAIDGCLLASEWDFLFAFNPMYALSAVVMGSTLGSPNFKPEKNLEFSG